jgi:hypothetical protein
MKNMRISNEAKVTYEKKCLTKCDTSTATVKPGTVNTGTCQSKCKESMSAMQFFSDTAKVAYEKKCFSGCENVCPALYVKCTYGYDPKDRCKQTCLAQPVTACTKMYVKCEYGYDPKDKCRQTCLKKPKEEQVMCIQRYVKCTYGYDPKDKCKQTCLKKPVDTGSKYTAAQCTTLCKNFMTT